MRMCRFLVACSSGPYRLRQATGATGETASSSPPASGCEASSSTGSGPTPAREAPTDTVPSAAASEPASAWTFPHLQFVVQGQDTRFANLPDDAVVPRTGALGTRGPLLSPHARSLAGRAVPEARLPHAPAKRLRGDRWAVRDADGLETEPADPTLDFVKRFRIAERLVGPFAYSHVSRSFDGGRLSYDRPAWNVTAMAVRPTHGGFEVSANREIGAVGLAGLALTLKRLPHAPPADVRVFYLYYDD